MGRQLDRCTEGGEDSPPKVRGTPLCPCKFWAQDSGLSLGPQRALAGSGPHDSSVPRNLDSPDLRRQEGQAERHSQARWGALPPTSLCPLWS